MLENRDAVIAETADSAVRKLPKHHCDHGLTPFISRVGMDPRGGFDLWKIAMENGIAIEAQCSIEKTLFTVNCETGISDPHTF